MVAPAPGVDSLARLTICGYVPKQHQRSPTQHQPVQDSHAFVSPFESDVYHALYIYVITYAITNDAASHGKQHTKIRTFFEKALTTPTAHQRGGSLSRRRGYGSAPRRPRKDQPLQLATSERDCPGRRIASKDCTFPMWGVCMLVLGR
jgi:hypothetical protein